MIQDRPGSTTDYTRVKANIQRMLDQNAPEADIDAYLSSEGVTPEQLQGSTQPAQSPQNMAQQPWQAIQGQATSVAGTGQLGNGGAVSYQLRPGEGSVYFRYADGREDSVPIGDLPPDQGGAFTQQYRALYGDEPPLSFSLSQDPNAPRPESFVQGVGEGLANVANHGAGWLEAGLNQVGGLGTAINRFGADYLGTAPSVDAAEANQRVASAASPYQGSALGRFAGEAAGLLPLAAVPGGAFAQGAAGGALMSDATTPLG